MSVVLYMHTSYILWPDVSSEHRRLVAKAKVSWWSLGISPRREPIPALLVLWSMYPEVSRNESGVTILHWKTRSAINNVKLQ